MNNNIENNKNIQWESAENKSSNWFKEKWEAVKDFLKWKKDAEVLNEEEATSEKINNIANDIGNEQLDNLHNKIESTFEEQGIIDETRDSLTEFFDEGKKEFSDNVQPIDEDGVNYETEVATLMNSKRFQDRSSSVVKGIVESAEKIKKEILHRKEQKNPVAKSLYRIVNRIIGTEK